MGTRNNHYPAQTNDANKAESNLPGQTRAGGGLQSSYEAKNAKYQDRKENQFGEDSQRLFYGTLH